MRSGGSAPPAANIGRRGGPEGGSFALPTRPRADVPMRSGPPMRDGIRERGNQPPRRSISSGGDIYSRRETFSNILDRPTRSGETRIRPSMGTYSPSYGAERRIREEMPMDVPVGEHRRQRLNKERLKTADHEGRHVMAAFAVGAKVDEVSVEPQGPSLGRTYVRASLPAYQIIAGASVSGKDADGYRNDLFQISQIDNYLGKKPGASMDAAIATAAQIISQHFPAEVQEKFAEILTIKRVLRGEAEVKKAMEQAFWEYAEEQKDPSIFQKYLDFKESQDWREILLHEQGIHPDSGSLVIEEYPEVSEYKFSEGDYSEQKTVYTCCGGENGMHAPNCKRYYGNSDEGNTLINPDLTNMRKKMDSKKLGDREISS